MRQAVIVIFGVVFGNYLLFAATPQDGLPHSQSGVAIQPLSVSTQPVVPRLVQISGRLRDHAGAPLTGVMVVTFSLYDEQEARSPLWVETQTVNVNANGQYAALLGATRADGLPAELFNSVDARWLGVEAAGAAEQPRMLLVSVPYALKAHDAETLGGRPASAYVLADGGRHATPSEAEAVTGAVATPGGPAPPAVRGSGTAGSLAQWIGASTIGNSELFQSAAGNIGIGTTDPGATLSVVGDVSATGAVYANAYRDLAGNAIPAGDVTAVVAGTGLTGGGASGDVSVALDTAFTDARYARAAHGHDVTQITNAATLSANTFAGTQRIDSGNFDLSPSTATTGNITKNGALFLHNAGSFNTFVGIGAGRSISGGVDNAAVGTFALRENTSGSGNVAIGSVALLTNIGGSSNTAVGVASLTHNTTGNLNTASGFHAMRFNTTGERNTAKGTRSLLNNTTGQANTAIGDQALRSNTAGNSNTAIGAGALGNNVEGANNVALGVNAGANSSGSNNIYLGAVGVAGESNTMYLGGAAQTRTFIAGVRGVTPVNPDATPVVIDSAGQLGTAAAGSIGDITSVAVGDGLTGGGASGDVTLALDTGFADGRYAQLAAANTFRANQTINGSLTATNLNAAESVTGASASFTSTRPEPVVSVRQDNSSTIEARAIQAVVQWTGSAVWGLHQGGTGTLRFTPGYGIFGESRSSSGTGVFGSATATSGITSGVMGTSASPDGVGVRGHATSPGGVGVRGYATATTGAPTAVQGIVQDGTTGTAIRGIQQNTGTSGIGVYGSHAGGGWGVYGSSVTGTGVKGSSTDVGIHGESTGNLGTAILASGFHAGLQAHSSRTSEYSFALLAKANSPAGHAGIFWNTAAGELLQGLSGPSGTPVFRVNSAGRVFANSGYQTGGADFAESVEVSGDREEYEPGDVLIIDTEQRRTMTKSRTAYSSMVAGIYSTKPGILATPHDISDPRVASEVPLAVIGIVPCKVSAENGPIAAGDLLVTASIPGHAMRGTDRGRMLGAIVGKALEPLQSGTGVIQVLVTLQ